MDLYYKQEVSVGLLVIVAAAILFGGIVWITGRSFGSGRTEFAVEFTNASGLQGGDPVLISGVRVGRVANIVLEDVGRVRVVLEVNSQEAPRMDARAVIKSIDFFGAKVIDYYPGQSSEMLPEGRVLTGRRETELTQTATGLADQAGQVLTGLQGFLSPEMATQVRSTMSAAQKSLETLTRVADGPLATDAGRALQALADMLVQLDSTVSDPNLRKSVRQLDEVMDGLNQMTEGFSNMSNSLASILQKIDDGEGSIGLLVTETELHDEMVSTMRSLRELLDDMRERPSRYFKITVF